MASLRNNPHASSGQGCLITFIPTLLAFGLGVMAIFFYGGFANGVVTHSVSAQPRLAGQGSTELASFYSPSVLHWAKAVENWSEEYGLDANLVATVMQIESCGDPQAQSSAGAQGLFQVMPFHFDPGENMTDPVINASRGLSYLKKSLDAANGDVRKALAGYNGGIGVVNRAEEYWPAETRRYAEWGSRMYQEASQGKDTSRTLQDWMQSGGSYLCNQASQKLLTQKP